MVPTQAHRIQTSLRSFEKATSNPTYSLHQGWLIWLVRLRERLHRNLQRTQHSSWCLLPLLPPAAHVGRSEGLVSRSSSRDWSLCSVGVSLWSLKLHTESWKKCCSINPISPPQDLTQGPDLRKPYVTHPTHAFQSCFTNNSADIFICIRLPGLFFNWYCT